jgi:hypothetical protein
VIETDPGGDVAMAVLSQFPTFLALIRSTFRLLPIVVIWLAISALETGCFLAARGVEGQLLDTDLVAFGPSMVVSSAVAAAAALALRGKVKLASRVALAVGLMMAITSAAIYVLFHVDPWTLRNKLDLWSFLRLKNSTRAWASDFAWAQAPFAAWVGLVAGLVCGLVSIVARKRPRWAVIATLVLLFGLAIKPAQEVVWNLLNELYWTIRSQEGAGRVNTDRTSDLGAAFGAVSGAFVAAIAIEMARRKAKRASAGPPRDAARGAGVG